LTLFTKNVHNVSNRTAKSWTKSIKEPKPEKEEYRMKAPDWRRLYESAVKIKNMAPRGWMSEMDIFGVEDLESSRIEWVSVMGATGEHFSVALYRDLEACYRYLIRRLNREGHQRWEDTPVQMPEMPPIRSLDQRPTTSKKAILGVEYRAGDGREVRFDADKCGDYRREHACGVCVASCAMGSRQVRRKKEEKRAESKARRVRVRGGREQIPCKSLDRRSTGL
jgi:hypothetical protein